MVMDGADEGEDMNSPTTIVTLECAAVLHIEEVWERGKLAIDYLRDQLGPDLREKLCPLRNDGVSLHKIYGVMHDTCNCANKVTPFTQTNPMR